MTRWLVINTGLYPHSRPWVVCEVVDDERALDHCGGWTDTVVLSREQALADPDVRQIALAWDSGDDSAAQEDLGRWRAEGDAENIVENAGAELAHPGLVEIVPLPIGQRLAFCWIAPEEADEREAAGTAMRYESFRQVHREVVEEEEREAARDALETLRAAVRGARPSPGPRRPAQGP